MLNTYETRHAAAAHRTWAGPEHTLTLPAGGFEATARGITSNHFFLLLASTGVFTLKPSADLAFSASKHSADSSLDS